MAQRTQTSPVDSGERERGGDADSRGGNAEGFRQLLAIHREARRRNEPALVVVHTPWGGGVDAVLKEWRRHLLGERESLFEAVCRPGGGTYAPLRDVVSRYVHSLDALGMVDEEVRSLVGHVSGVLGLPALPGVWEPPPRPRPEAGGQLQFFEHLGRLFLALGERLPAALLFQDVHRADSATRVAMQYLCDSVFSDALSRFAPSGLTRPRFAGTVVLTGTDAALVDLDLRRLLDGRPDVHLLGIQTAEESAFRRALNDDAVVARLMRATGGSLEALRELVDTLPARAEELFMRRLAPLQPAERAVLEALAVLGRPARPDFLLRVAGVAGDAPSLSALAELRLINRQVTRGELLIDFPTVDVRLGLYDTISASRRADLHARIAEYLEERSRLGEAVDLEVIAQHYLYSNVGPKAVEHALEAAERLHISYAFQRAAEILHALHAMELDTEARRTVLERLVEVHVAMGNNEDALRFNEERLSVAPRETRPAIQRRHGEILTEIGSYDAALERFEAAERVLGEWVDGDDPIGALEALRLCASRSEAFYGKGEYDRATTEAESGLEGLAAKPDEAAERVAIRLANTLGKVHLFLGNHEQALEVFRRNHRTARERGWPDEEVRALFNQGTIALQQRRHEDAERIFQDCIAFGDATANPLTRAFCLLNLAVAYHKTLRYAEAVDAYLHGLSTFRQSGNELQYAVTAMNLGALYETIGDRDRARGLLQESIEVSTRRDIKYFRGRAFHILGLVELGAERWHEAQQVLSRAQDVLGRTGTQTFRDRIRIAEARAAHGLGNRSQRDRILKELHCDGDDQDAREVRTERDLYHGLFLLEDGRLDEACRCLGDALATAEELNIHEHVWKTRLHLAQACMALGDLRRARALLQAAADLIDHIGQQLPEPLQGFYRDAPDRAAVRDALARLERGPTASPDTPEAPDGSVVAPDWRDRYGMIIGEDERLHQLFRIVERVADSESTILILGESGTGKELVAEAIHRRSPRRPGPFIKVNCAAFVETLLLSELFGHERGAFTGAQARKVGRFEAAEGGTLFLDEIGDISANTQVALLRVLQERTFERVGSSTSMQADVRIVCATNRNLEEMVRAGSFRLDLYYRLKGVVLELPPLRDRRRDIPLLVEHFAGRLLRDGQRPRRFSRDAMAFLVRYSWPGNIRELENFLSSMLLFVDGEVVELRHILQFRDFFADGGFLDEDPPWIGQLPETLPASPAAADAPRAGTESVSRRRAVPRETRLEQAADRLPGAVADRGAPSGPAPDEVSEHAGHVPSNGAAQSGQSHNHSGPALDEDSADGASAEERIASWALDTGVGLPGLKKRLEAALIREALLQAQGNVTQAAKLLDMKRPRLSQLINGDPELEKLKRELSSGGSG